MSLKRAKFLLEANEGQRVDSPHGLQRDQLAPLLVVRLVDHPHSPRSEATDECETDGVQHRPEIFGFRLQVIRFVE